MRKTLSKRRVKKKYSCLWSSSKSVKMKKLKDTNNFGNFAIAIKLKPEPRLVSFNQCGEMTFIEEVMT